MRRLTALALLSLVALATAQSSAPASSLSSRVPRARAAGEGYCGRPSCRPPCPPNVHAPYRYGYTQDRAYKTYAPNVGLRAYRIVEFNAGVTRCANGRSIADFHVAYDLSALPDTEIFYYSFQSKTSRGKWANLCLHDYRGQKKVCVFASQGGHSRCPSPETTDQSLYQVRSTRGANHVTDLRLAFGVVYDGGTGSLPASFPKSITFHHPKPYKRPNVNGPPTCSGGFSG